MRHWPRVPRAQQRLHLGIVRHGSRRRVPVRTATGDIPLQGKGRAGRTWSGRRDGRGPKGAGCGWDVAVVSIVVAIIIIVGVVIAILAVGIADVIVVAHGGSGIILETQGALLLCCFLWLLLVLLMM